MYDLCILKEEEIKYAVPFEWNSLEHYDENTCLIHYTDMATQPWVSWRNRYGYLWFEEVKLMLANGSLTIEELDAEIKRKYFRPSLLPELRYSQYIPQPLKFLFHGYLRYLDKQASYQPHQEVYQLKKIREQALENR